MRHPEPEAARRKRRRDRRGRGIRGPLAPPRVPLARSRAEQFDELVADVVRWLELRSSNELSRVEFAVEDVPAVAPWADGADTVPLAQLLPADERRPARIVVYRHPIEARAGDPDMLQRLVRDVVVEQVAELLGLSPESLDPSYEPPGE